MNDCTIGKDFNPKSCRWIKGCRNGYSRNKEFKCVRGSDTIKEVEKEAFDLVKELFSNENNGNGLKNSISPQRTKTKRLSKKSNSSKSKTSKTSSYSELKQRIKKFIESIDKNVLNIEEDVFKLAKLKGIQIKNPRQQYLLRKMLMEHMTSKGKGKGKSVKFAKTPTNTTSPNIVDEPTIVPKSKSKSSTKSKTKKTNETPKPTNEELKREEKINIFLNTLTMKTIQNISTQMVSTDYKYAGIELDTREKRQIFRNIAEEHNASYTTMNRERALNALELRIDYTLKNLETNYKIRSRDIFSNEKFDLEDKRMEYDRLDKAYSRLKEKFERNVKDDKNDTVFMFYSKSKDSKPGMGAGEQISEENIPKYKELSKIKDWRKRLSNFWVQPFEIDGKQWQSVEHYYQGSKFRGNPDFFNQFSLDSGSDLSKDPLLAKAAGGKTGKLGKEQIRPKEIVMDTNFFEGRHSEEMQKGQFAKFTQNPDLMNMLLQTKDAQLFHYTRSGKPVLFTGLMLIRTRNK
jgi:predicted NAD-dependent protein-ADP-ribosyltransferase YbiA (DUF1768 family)